METSKIWTNKGCPGVELLSASYTTFQFSKHWHDELAIDVIEDEAEGLLYRGKNIIIPKRHIVAINPAEVHTGFSGIPNGWRYRMFYFNLTNSIKYFLIVTYQLTLFLITQSYTMNIFLIPYYNYTRR